MGVWETLNGVYEQLYRRVQSIGKALAEAGYTARWGWYNLHGSDGAALRWSPHYLRCNHKFLFR